MAATRQTDILVAGTGPAGMIAALALAGQGLKVTIAGPEVRADDERTTALMMPAVRFLDEVARMPDLLAGAAPMRVMRIIDATSRLVRSPVVTFRAQEIGEEAFGYNFTNKALNAALRGAIVENDSISWRKALISEWILDSNEACARLDDGADVRARLAVAADGHNSPARAAAGIETRRSAYRQTALAMNFGHSVDHDFISNEFHTDTGPFTQVPLPGRRSSLVWAVRPDMAERLLAMDDASISALIEERMQSMLGKVEVGPGRQAYPLSVLVPRHFARSRVALVGEAAHVFPPIGAQGLNLGIRDVADLADAVRQRHDDPGAEAVLAAYDRKRRPDIMARTGAVDLLNRSLLTDMLPAQVARSAGLAALGALSPLRGFFMREGMQPGSGFRHIAASLREQVRR